MHIYKSPGDLYFRRRGNDFDHPSARGITDRRGLAQGLAATHPWTMELERVDGAKYRPIGRMQGPHWYCRTRDLFERERPQ